MGMNVFDLCEASDREPNHMNQSESKLVLQGSEYLDVRIREVNCGGFQLVAFGHRCGTYMFIKYGCSRGCSAAMMTLKECSAILSRVLLPKYFLIPCRLA